MNDARSVWKNQLRLFMVEEGKISSYLDVVEILKDSGCAKLLDAVVTLRASSRKRKERSVMRKRQEQEDFQTGVVSGNVTRVNRVIKSLRETPKSNTPTTPSRVKQESNPRGGLGGTKSHPGKTSPEVREYPLPPSLDCEKVREAWQTYLDSREDMKKPMTLRAARLLWRRLEAWSKKWNFQAGEYVEWILERSVMNQWLGVFEDRGWKPELPNRPVVIPTSTYVPEGSDDYQPF